MIDIDIIYEDDDVLVINKPAGVVVHEDGFGEEETVVDWFLKHVPEARGVGEPGYSPKGDMLERSGVVHRLDRDTSGVLILAKNATAFTYFKSQFHDRLVKKEYRAFVYGLMKERWGTINKKIGRSPSDFRKRSAMPGAKGTLREAVTEWECLDSAELEGETFSYLLLKPKTGRTHQLRVHLRAIDRPIVMDGLYAAHIIETSHNLAFDRMALHAHKLDIILPNGEKQQFIAPLPNEFKIAVSRIAEG